MDPAASLLLAMVLGGLWGRACGTHNNKWVAALGAILVGFLVGLFTFWR